MAPRGRSVTLGIDLVANDKGASKALAAQRTEVAGLGDELQRTANLLGGGFVAYRGFEALQGVTEDAANLREAQNTSNQVFKEANDTVAEFAANAADAYGQSERLALQSTTAFGNLLNNAGFARDVSSEWSVTLAQLGSDLAAFKNVAPDEAITALTSALAGETEPMRRFGVELTQRNLELDAMSLGLGSNITELSRRQRLEVILTSIMRQTTDVQGQFTREIEGYNQQQAIATAKAEDAKAAFGDGLIPVFTQLQRGIGAVADAFSSLPSGVQTATSVIAATGVAVLGVTSAVGLLGPAVKNGASTIAGLASASRNAALNLVLPSKAIDGLGSSATQSSGKVGGFINRLGGLGAAASLASIAAIGVGGALYGMQQDSQRAAERAANLRAEVDLLTQSAETLGQTIEETFTKQNLVKLWKEQGGALDDYGLSASNLQDALTGTADEYEKFLIDAFGNEAIFSRGTNPVIRALDDQRNAFLESTEQTERGKDAKKDLGLAEDDAAGAMDRTTAAAKKQESVFERLTKVTDAQRDKIEAQWSARDRMKAATQEVADANADLAAVQRAAAGDSDEYRDALRSVGDAQESLADAQRGVADAQERVNQARKAAAERLEDLREKVDELRQSEERANLTTRQAQQAARDALADPRLTALEKEDAQLKAKEAAQAERDLKSERADAARELAEAQARGIEGDKDVIDAKEGVVEAERRVREAARQVADAQKRAAQVIQDAKERVKEASERVEDATLDEAAAWGELNEAQFGATAGVVAHIGALNALLATLAPGSPLALAVEARRNDLLGLATLAAITDAAQSAFNQAGNLPGLFGDAATLYQRGAGVTVNQTFQGTPQQQRRAMADAAGGFFDGLARGAR